jgi:hypothetical protein
MGEQRLACKQHCLGEQRPRKQQWRRKRHDTGAATDRDVKMFSNRMMLIGWMREQPIFGARIRRPMPSVPLVRSRRAGLKPGWSCCRPCPILSNSTVRDRICKKLLGIARAIHTVKPLVVHPSRALGPTKHPSSFLGVGCPLPAGISSAWFSIPLARSFLVDRRSVPCAHRPAYRTVT